MAFLDKIFGFFVPTKRVEPEIIVSAPMTTYEIRPLTEKHLKEVLKLNLRCFKEGENYTKYTFAYLLNEPNCISYQLVTPKNQMVAFVFVIVEHGIGHITTIGVAPEHRRRGLAQRLLNHAEEALKKRNIITATLEVRVSNSAAQSLYRGLRYSTVQRIKKYYNNGEDGFLMVKSLF
jgi:[ribosomal protein S18]-alanine N-acetyltransferase